jgi:hypothetical protein
MSGNGIGLIKEGWGIGPFSSRVDETEYIYLNYSVAAYFYLTTCGMI